MRTSQDIIKYCLLPMIEEIESGIADELYKEYIMGRIIAYCIVLDEDLPKELDKRVEKLK